MEHVAANELPDGHGEVGDQTKPGYPHASIVLIGGGEVDIVMMMMVVVMVAMVATVVSRLGGHWR